MTAASSARRHVVIALVACALLSRAALAQVPSEAAKIIEAFGSGGRLDRTGIQRYLNSDAFKTIDPDNSGTLDAGEYMSAQLYARLPACGNAQARAMWLSESSGGPVDAQRLYDGNPMWKKFIDETVDASWKRASPGNAPLDEAGLSRYLDAERARHDRIPTAAERLKALTGGQNADVTIAQFETFFTSEWFDRVDVNRSGELTFVEFTRASAYPTAATEFCALAGSDGTVTQDDLDDVAGMEAEAPVLQLQRRRSARDLRLAVSPLARVPVGTVQRVFEKQEKAAREQAELGALSPKGFVPGAGLLFAGTRQLTEDNAISWDHEKPAAFLRIIKDFTVDDPVQAEPALFTIAHERGAGTTYAVHGTIQVDMVPASFKVVRGAFGVDIDRLTGPEGTNTQTYYGTLHLFFGHRGWLESSYITFSPNLEDNRMKQTTKVAGDLAWQPGLKIGRFATNQWLPVESFIRFYITPRAAVEFGEVTRAPEGTDKPSVTNLRVELAAGLKFGKRVVATYRGLQRAGAGDSHYQEASLRWNIDDQDRFSLKTSIADGRKTTTADDERTAAIGLGVKF